MLGSSPIAAPDARVLCALDAGLEEVRRVFDAELATDLPPAAQLVRHVERYRGKMLRPTLVLLMGMASADAWAAGRGIEPGSLLTREMHVVGAVVEMVHMATLVHDDVLDEADVRRQGRTVNKLHGNEPAVILGDYLFASAYRLCSTLESQATALAVGRASVVTAAGELLQLHHRGDLSLDEPTYEAIIDRKTAELIATSCRLGAWHARASAEGRARRADAAEAFGRLVGRAFQIQDDLLDLTGEEGTVGKSVDKDLEKGKLTLPLIHHLAAATPMQRGRSLRLVLGEDDEHRRSDPARARAEREELVDALAATGSVAYAGQAARSLIGRAKAALAALPDSPARDTLCAMADAVVDRKF